jgi:hypothetical protein
VFDKQPWNDIHHTTSSVTFADYSKAHTITNVCRKIRAETQALGNKSRTFGFVDKDNFLSCISRFTVNQRNAITHVKLQYELEATIIVPPPGGALETMTFVDSSPDLDILPHLPHLRHGRAECRCLRLSGVQDHCGCTQGAYVVPHVQAHLGRGEVP